MLLISLRFFFLIRFTLYISLRFFAFIFICRRSRWNCYYCNWFHFFFFTSLYLLLLLLSYFSRYCCCFISVDFILLFEGRSLTVCVFFFSLKNIENKIKKKKKIKKQNKWKLLTVAYKPTYSSIHVFQFLITNLFIYFTYYMYTFCMYICTYVCMSVCMYVCISVRISSLLRNRNYDNFLFSYGK